MSSEKHTAVDAGSTAAPVADEPVQGQPDRLDDTDTFDIGELWRDVGGSD